MMKTVLKKVIIIVLALALFLPLITGITSFATAEQSNDTQDKTTDYYLGLSRAIDATKSAIVEKSKSEVYNFSNNYIFDADELANIYLLQDDQHGYSEFANGSSSVEASKDFSKKFGMNVNVGLTVPTSVGAVGGGISAAFDKSVAGSISNATEEYYEYVRYYKYAKKATSNFSNIDLTSCFSDGFVKDLEKITDLNSAIQLLEKYGTHIPEVCYFGGVLNARKYVVASSSISQSYEDRNATLGLNATIANGMTSEVGLSSSVTESQMVNASDVKTTIECSVTGGNDVGGISLDHLFTYRQEIANQSGGSGYVYQNWLKSIENEKVLKIVYIEQTIALWDVLEKSSLHNENLEALLEQAYKILLYKNYVAGELEDGAANPLFDTVSYSNDSYTSSNFSVNATTMDVPKGVNVHYVPTKLLQEIGVDNVTFDVASNSASAAINGNTPWTINISNDSDSGTVIIDVKATDITIAQIKLNVVTQGLGYSGGLGTQAQPYWISTSKDWKEFVTKGPKESSCYYVLTNDIDLCGESIIPFGSQGKETPFSGYFDGQGYKISNLSVIISNKQIKNIGIFGTISGAVKNLNIEDVCVMSSGIVELDKNDIIYAGILCGKNTGTISGVSIKNSAIRIVSEGEGTVYIGALVGENAGSSEDNDGKVGNLEFIGITNVHIGGKSIFKNQQFTGGIAGYTKDNATISNSYVRELNIDAYSNNVAKQIAVGYIAAKAEKTTIEYCFTYNNTHKNKPESYFGHLVGNADNTNAFSNCYFEDTSETNNEATDKKARVGCFKKHKLDFNDIDDSYTSVNWCADSKYGNRPVLKIHKGEN